MRPDASKPCTGTSELTTQLPGRGRNQPQRTLCSEAIGTRLPGRAKADRKWIRAAAIAGDAGAGGPAMAKGCFIFGVTKMF